jgi:hypothetical protein
METETERGKKYNISLPATFEKKKEKVIKPVRAEQQRTVKYKKKKDKRYMYFFVAKNKKNFFCGLLTACGS